MIIRIYLIGPGIDPDPGLMTIDYTNRKYHKVLSDVRGVCFNGHLGPLRFSEIYVVKQRTAGMTMLMVAHEVLHAFVWCLRLPSMFNRWIERYVVLGEDRWRLTRETRRLIGVKEKTK